MKGHEFDVLSCPLDGWTLVEASAGTGKTWNIGGLYLRFLLEKRLEVKDILVVTFTRAATDELRDRIGTGLPPHWHIWKDAGFQPAMNSPVPCWSGSLPKAVPVKTWPAFCGWLSVRSIRRLFSPFTVSASGHWPSRLFPRDRHSP